MFLNNMKRLPNSIKETFDQGNFHVKKTSHVFPAMGIHQAHEQNNRANKVDGGAIGIMGNESVLLEWALSGPYVAKMICESTIPVPQTTMKIQNHSKRRFARGKLN